MEWQWITVEKSFHEALKALQGQHSILFWDKASMTTEKKFWRIDTRPYVIDELHRYLIPRLLRSCLPEMEGEMEVETEVDIQAVIEMEAEVETEEESKNGSRKQNRN
jgi:hypothetical protein